MIFIRNDINYRREGSKKALSLSYEEFFSFYISQSTKKKEKEIQAHNVVYSEYKPFENPFNWDHRRALATNCGFKITAYLTTQTYQFDILSIVFVSD